MKVGDLIKYYVDDIDGLHGLAFEIGIITNIEESRKRGKSIITIWDGDATICLFQHELEVMNEAR